MSSKDPIVIIGSGQAGVTLARELRKINPEQPLTLITEDMGGFYSKPMLSNAFAKKLSPEKLLTQDKESLAEKTNIQILANTSVVNIRKSSKKLLLESQGQDLKTFELAYDKIVFAVGATPLQPPIPGIEHAISINHLSDYRKLRDKLTSLQQKTGKPANIVIIGGGLVGSELANDLYFGGHGITLIEREPQLLPKLTSPEISRALQTQFDKLGMAVLTDTNVEAIEYSPMDDDSDLVVKTDREAIPAHLVISAMGLLPRVDVAKRAGLVTNKGIQCNPFLETSDPDIYALGDCAEIEGLILPYILPIMEGARALAQTLNGNRTPVKYPCMPIAIKTSSYPLIVCPPLHIHHPDIKIENEHLEKGDEDSPQDSLRTLYYRGDKLVGFCLSGAAAKERQKYAAETLGYFEQLEL